MLNYLKSISAALTAFGGSYLVATQDNHVTVNEWIAAGIAGLSAAAVVWGIPNAGADVPTAEGDPGDEDLAADVPV